MNRRRPILLLIVVASAIPARAAGPDDPPSRVVRGIVVDEQDRPVAGATVRPIARDRAAQAAVTETNGAFLLRMDGGRPSEGLFAFDRGGIRLGTARFKDYDAAPPSGGVRIVLKPSRLIRVHVRDADGKPVANAQVEATGFDYLGAATADAEGEASLRVPADAEIRTILGLKSGVGFDYFESYRPRADAAKLPNNRPDFEVIPLPDDVTLTLHGGGVVRIHAVDSDDQPIAGIVWQPLILGKPGKLDRANLSFSTTSVSQHFS